jgi:hypothetical protein
MSSTKFKTFSTMSQASNVFLYFKFPNKAIDLAATTVGFKWLLWAYKIEQKGSTLGHYNFFNLKLMFQCKIHQCIYGSDR